MQLSFTKMHGLGNDFVVFNAIDQQLELSAGQIRFIADRRFGIGCDQVLLVEAARTDEREPIYEGWIAGAARLRAEVPFVAPLAGVLVEGTIDALAEDSAGAWRIIDYKTGAAGAEKLDAYRFQVGLYCAAVREVTGDLPAGAAIVLLDRQEVVRLDPQADADRALEAATSVVEGIRAGQFPHADTCEGVACPLAYACELT